MCKLAECIARPYVGIILHISASRQLEIVLRTAQDSERLIIVKFQFTFYTRHENIVLNEVKVNVSCKILVYERVREFCEIKFSFLKRLKENFTFPSLILKVLYLLYLSSVNHKTVVVLSH
jgi:hypothetical protein